MKSMYAFLASEGLTNTHSESLAALVTGDKRFHMYCNNEARCARNSTHKNGAWVSTVTHPRKHKHCPNCQDTRIVLMPVGED